MIGFEDGLVVLGLFLVAWAVVEILVKITGADKIDIED